MSYNIPVTGNIFDREKELEGLPVQEELLSIHAINPFTNYNSASRNVMMAAHLSQTVTLEHGEEPIVQTGLERQLADNVWNVKAEHDSRVIAVIDRYSGISADEVNAIAEIVIVYEDLITGEIDYYSVPYKFNIHQNYGFKYKWNYELLESLVPGYVIPAGTVLATSPSVKENNGFGFGLNANLALMTMPEVAEDGFVISESYAEKLEHKTFETITIEYGSDSFPLNLYGDEDNYKPFPEIGEYVNEDGVIIALRKYNTELAPALISKKDVLEYDSVFDKPFYTKHPKGKVVDIIVHTNDRFKKSIYTGVNEIAEKYNKSLINYYEKLIDVYEKVQKEHYHRVRNWQLPTSEKLSRLMVEAYAMVNKEGVKLKKTFKKQELDLFRVTFVVEHVIKGKKGLKLSCLNGGKGVIVSILPDDQMPIDEYGNRADIIADSTSTIGRMNLAKLYIQYFSATSREIQHHVKTTLIGNNKDNISNIELVENANDNTINTLFDHILGLLRIIGNEQYEAYSAVNSLEVKRTILLEIIEKEFYIYYKVSNEKKAYSIVTEIHNSIYAPKIGKLLFNIDGTVKTSLEDILIAPLYMICLSKNADNFLSAASAKANHYGLPVGVSKFDRPNINYKNSATRVLGETEVRLIAAYGGRKAIAELKDRASSPKTHETIYNTILRSDTPTNIDTIIDRNKLPYGGDVGLKLVESIFNASGIEIVYSKED